MGRAYIARPDTPKKGRLSGAGSTHCGGTGGTAARAGSPELDGPVTLPSRRISQGHDCSGVSAGNRVAFRPSFSCVSERNPMIANLCLRLYSAFAHVLALGAMLYLIGFMGDVLVPKTIDSGAL